MPYHAIVLHLVWPDIDIEFKIDNVDDLDELDNLDELDWLTKDWRYDWGYHETFNTGIPDPSVYKTKLDSFKNDKL